MSFLRFFLIGYAEGRKNDFVLCTDSFCPRFAHALQMEAGLVCAQARETQMGVWGGAGQVKSARALQMEDPAVFSSVLCWKCDVRACGACARKFLSFPASVVFRAFFFAK